MAFIAKHIIEQDRVRTENSNKPHGAGTLNPKTEDTILALLKEDPATSTQKIAEKIGISRRAVINQTNIRARVVLQPNREKPRRK